MAKQTERYRNRPQFGSLKATAATDQAVSASHFAATKWPGFADRKHALAAGNSSVVSSRKFIFLNKNSTLGYAFGAVLREA